MQALWLSDPKHRATDTQLYAVTGNIVPLWPRPNDLEPFVVWYGSDIVPLSALNPTNFILQRYPHLYFLGGMSWAEALPQNDERAGLWRATYDTAVEQLIARDRVDRMGSSPLVGRYGRR